MILHKISRFFELDCYAFPAKVCILNQFAYSCNVHLTKKLQVYFST